MSAETNSPARNHHVASKVNEWIATSDLDHELAAALSKWTQKTISTEGVVANDDEKKDDDEHLLGGDDDDEYEEITVEDEDEFTIEEDEITVEDQKMKIEINQQDVGDTLVVDNEQGVDSSSDDVEQPKRESLAVKVQEWVGSSSLNDPELKEALSKWSQSSGNSPEKDDCKEEEIPPSIEDRVLSTSSTNTSLLDVSNTIHECEEESEDEENLNNVSSESPLAFEVEEWLASSDLDGDLTSALSEWSKAKIKSHITTKVGEVSTKSDASRELVVEDATEVLSDMDENTDESQIVASSTHGGKSDDNPVIEFLRGIGGVLAKLARPCNKPQ